jgi:voltage-gated potassium channel Kch
MRRPVQHALVKMQEPDYGLPVFLALLVLMAFVLPSLGLEGSDERLYGAVTASLMLVLGVAVASGERWAFVLTLLMAVAALIVRWAAWIYPTGTLGAWPQLVSCVTVLLFSVVILRQVVRPGPVTVSRVLGAIAVYLLLGIGWAGAYQVAEHFFPGSFVSTTTEPVSVTEWMYFSFVTLTTVGYGDIVPVHRVARSLATGEALTGQLYIAVLLARLVSLEVSNRNR